VRLLGTVTILILSVTGAAAVEPDELLLVACAPGYPGNTEQAQPSMDRLAAGVAAAAGWKEGRLAAVYHETEEAGLEQLANESAALALVPLPFYLSHRERFALAPLLTVVDSSGPAQVWSLVARKGATNGASSLQGWELTGVPGYSPGFVREVALADWGELPGEVEIGPTSRVLSALRRAAAGEPVAVLLDRAQAAALPSLPFGDELEVLARSSELPGTLLCSVADRLPESAAATLVEKLPAMHETTEGRELLADLRIERFARLDRPALTSVETLFEGGRSE
jgi:hypothetical protein